jgi:uncharacterized membrane protein YphA (DoxX/SURF4 family)
MKYLLFRMKRFCGFITGFVFFISGILKLMDPTGAGLVMKEYFRFLHLGFLNGTATAAGVAFALAETIIGAALITGVWRKITAMVATALQTFFTFITLLLVIFQPEMDCGCFGEAIHLTHGETFVKNIILLALLLIYYIPRQKFGGTKKKKYVSFGLVSLSTVAFAIYSLLYIPMVDFTDFRPGTLVNSDKTSGSGVYQAVFIYEKDGKEDTFTLETLPDSTWTFVRTETQSPAETEKQPATISIYDRNGNYADHLLTEGKSIIISIYKDKVTQKEQEQIIRTLDNAAAAGFRPFLLSASADIDCDYIYFCDYKTLITLNRSNGGATYMEDGYIIRKWAKKALPDAEELTMLSKEDSTETFIGRDTRSNLAFQGFLLYVFAVMLLL